MKKDQVNKADYVWVITETKGMDENYLGLVGDDGLQFIPVTSEKEEMEALQRKLPPNEDSKLLRQVEVTHKSQVIKQAEAEGFAVLRLDADGKIMEKLAGPPSH